MRTLAILLFALSAIGAESGVVVRCAPEIKGAQHILDEVTVLSKKSPLPYKVQVILIGKADTAWCVSSLERGSKLIYIMPVSKKEQVKCLRHEWKHLEQESKGQPYDEEEAVRSEYGNLLPPPKGLMK